jgi:hypothetical protein
MFQIRAIEEEEEEEEEEEVMVGGGWWWYTYTYIIQARSLPLS